MGTPGTVATINEDNGGWIGRYVNYDAYPNGLGIDLFEAYHTAFEGNPFAMVDKLVLEPKADWSALSGTDMSLEPTWYEFGEIDGPRPPRNYFFRPGEGATPPLKTGDDFGQYLYLIGQDGMNVYVKYSDDVDVPAYTFIPWTTSIEEARAILKELNDKINGR